MRVLTPGPRPAIALGVLTVVISIILLVLTPPGRISETLKVLALLALVIGFVLGHIYLTRITVDDAFISWRAGPWSEHRIPFSEISRSMPRILAERNHPVSLDIFGLEPPAANAKPKLRIRLKAFRQSDVTWLMSLPQLKVLQ